MDEFSAYDDNSQQHLELLLPSVALAAFSDISLEDTIASTDNFLHHYNVLQEEILEEYPRQGFCAGELKLMIAYADGSELIDLPEIYHLPNVPAWMLGVINLHGAVIPVIDVAIFASLAHRVDSKNSNFNYKLIILGHGTDAIGVLIDNLPQRLRFNIKQLANSDNIAANLREYVRDAYLIDGVIWHDLDVELLLLKIEESLQLQ